MHLSSRGRTYLYRFMQFIAGAMQLDAASLVIGAGIAFVGIPVTKAILTSAVNLVRTKIARRQFNIIRARKRSALVKIVDESAAWAQQHLPTGKSLKLAQELIANQPLASLQEALRNNVFTAVEILAVYLDNAVSAHKQTNCLSWIMLHSAIEAALSADRTLSSPKGKQRDDALAAQPLLGVPISIKEMLAYRNTDCTLGLTSRAEQPLEDTSASVLVLERQGAVVFAKTSVPVLLMSYECESDLFGTTTNPHNSGRTCGGSSGGEGALLALNGAAVGLGTDIGGSIRIPAAFCGIVGFKPTFLRVSSRGNRAIRGDESIPTITGPMGRRVADVTEIFKCLSTPPPTAGTAFQIVDGMCGHVPFRTELHDAALTKKVLRVGYYEHDGFIDSSPASARAVRIAVEALRAAGHEVVPFAPPFVEETISCFYELLGADGTRKLRALLGFDVPYGVVGPLLAYAGLPSFLKYVAVAALRFKVDATFANILYRAQEKRVDEYGDVLIRRNNCRNAYADLFASLKLDAVIGPGFYVPAPACGSSTDLSYGAAATAYYNCLDLPVLALPVTKVQPGLDAWTAQPSNGMSRCVKAIYDHEKMKGMPVGIQLVSPKFTEEVTLAIGKRLEGLLRDQSH